MELLGLISMYFPSTMKEARDIRTKVPGPPPVVTSPDAEHSVLSCVQTLQHDVGPHLASIAIWRGGIHIVTLQRTYPRIRDYIRARTAGGQIGAGRGHPSHRQA